jgi:hypothetical protein
MARQARGRRRPRAAAWMPWCFGRSKPGSTWTRPSAAKTARNDAAVAVLLDLQALAERGGNGNAFSRRFRQLRPDLAHILGLIATTAL